MEIKQFMCRTCCRKKKTKKLTSISSIIEESENLTIAEFINLVTQLNIRETDGLPGKICSKCFDNLKLIRDFRTLCIDSNNYWKSLEQPKYENCIVIKEELRDEFVNDSEIPDFIENVEVDWISDGNNLEELPDQKWVQDPEDELPKESKRRKKVEKIANSKSLCGICGKLLVDYRTLYHHEKIHKNEGKPKERRFQCGICGSKFVRKKNLVIHMFSHTGKTMKTLRFQIVFINTFNLNFR